MSDMQQPDSYTPDSSTSNTREASSRSDTGPSFPNTSSPTDTEYNSPASADKAFEMAASTSATERDLSASCMTGFSKDDWHRSFQRLAAVFPLNSETAPDTAIEVYAAVTKTYSRAQLQDALMEWLRTGTRFPYPADLIGLIERRRTE